MPPREQDRLRHILEAADRAIAIASQHDLDDILDDETLQYSLFWLLGVVGEAARHLPASLEHELDLPLSKMVATRNRITHGYFDINVEMAFRTALDDLPPVAERIRAYLRASR